MAFRDPADVDAERTAASSGRDIVTRPTSADAAPSARLPLEDYPPHRSRLSLALDPYSRMSLPDRDGRGEVQKRPTSDIVWGAACCFVTIAVLGLIDAHVKATFGVHTPFMSGAWGTISVLAFGTMENPAARTYNCVVATVFSTLAVAFAVSALGVSWYSRALTMAIALAFMMLTGSVHPPGAAAIMACMDQKALQDLGFAYAAYPVLFGSLFILAMGKLCARLKREHEFVLLWRWRGFSRPVKGSLFGFEKRKGHPVLYRKSAYGFKAPPRILRVAGVDAAVPAAAAVVRAEPSDSGAAAVGDAMNDAMNDALRSNGRRDYAETRRSRDETSRARSERASLANVDESRIETEGTVTYSFY